MSGNDKFVGSIIDSAEDSLESLLARQRRLEESKWTFRLAKRVVQLYCQYCRVRLADNLENEQESKEREVNFGWWSDLYFGAFLMSIGHLFVNIYHQYRLDIGLLHRNRLQEQIRAQFAQGSQPDPWLGEQLRALNNTIEEKRQLLKSIGAPSVNLSFAIECIYLVVIFMPTVCYLIPLIFLRHVFKFDVYLVRVLVDLRREYLISSRHIERQVAEYVNSSRNFDRLYQEARLNRFLLPTWKRYIENKHCPRGHLPDMNFIERMMIELRDSNKLVPFTIKPEWTTYWQLPFVSMCLFGIVYGLCFTVYVIVMLNHLSPITNSMNNQFDSSNAAYSWLDYLVMGETSVLLLAINFASTFYGALFLFACIDSSMYANHLRRLMCTCIQSHQFRFRRLDSVLARDPKRNVLEEPERELMNKEVLYLVVHYKLYMRILAKFKTLFGLVTMGCLMMMALIPLVTHLHVPYFQSEIDRDLKFFLIILSLMVLLIAIAFCMPACFTDKRNSDLHKQLTYLTTHVISMGTRENFANFYHEHLVSLLHRECGDPHSIHQVLALFGSSIIYNYQNIMRLYFWFGIILVSIYSRARHR